MILCFSSVVMAQENPGLVLANGLGCRACHLISDRGGNAGPPLDGLGRRMSREQLQDAIAHKHTESSPEALPHYSHLTGLEIRLLTDFLGGL